MTLPTTRDWLFSLKTFIAGMLALYLALSFDLERPYWALSAVYIVSNPFSGATRSKALYRALGTVIGAAASVALLPLLADKPILLAITVSLWTGTLLFFSMLERRARSYVFMLAGYTLPLVALSSVTSPATVFATALSRSEEIILGIVCASLVNTLLFPASLSGPFKDRIDGWLADTAAWAGEILKGEGASPLTPIKRQALASDVTSLDLIISQLGYDHGARDIRAQAKALRGRLLMLLPQMSSLADRLHALKQQEGDLPAPLVTLLSEVAEWIGEKSGGAPATAEIFLQRLGALEATCQNETWSGLLYTSLLARLRQIISLWHDCIVLANAIGSGKATLPDSALLTHQPVSSGRHHDRALLLLKAAVVVGGTFASFMVWLALGFAQGSSFVAMAAVAGSFFAAQDRPAPMIRAMTLWTALSVAVAFVYVYGVFPMVTSFPIMVMVLAPFFLYLGTAITNPQTGMMGLLLAVNVATLIGFQDRYSANMVNFANGGLATVLGLGFALAWNRLTHPFGAELAARRLLRSGWQDLADMASGAAVGGTYRLATRNLDRLGQLVPRLAAMNARELADVDGFADLRLGLNVAILQDMRPHLPATIKDNVVAVLHGIAEHYKRQARSAKTLSAPEDLRQSIDAALHTSRTGQIPSPLLQSTDPHLPASNPAGSVTVQDENADRRAVIDALVGIRRVLFPTATPPQEADPRHASSFAIAAE
ncbi:FUSC family protein [Allorhizobium sp. BGMRC 0089]|uniref:FUSC family protein n=1 Tax=Allorhizobium sonneratiae TaxID=2934936 RepID=UPI0020346712|nr:FUSC family protein [Allorhizobium sonneratiae]MCM2290949.1 FUSC family protein [Allorhizobium sonneratiae]